MKRDPRDFDQRWKEESRRMFDSSEARKVFQNVFDSQTQSTLLELADEKIIDKLYGVVESGKESQIFLADTPDNERVIVKIYMTRAGGFREMEVYLRGDKRFRNFKSGRRNVIYEWCRKEFKNLKKAEEVVEVPSPIAQRKNILVMEFIGKNFSPYPKLKQVEIENPETGFNNILKGIERLWNKEKIVHGDLSEYNMLVREDELVWIDFSQGVHKSHPEAKNLLKRDIDRISDFFQKQGYKTDPRKAYKSVIGD